MYFNCYDAILTVNSGEILGAHIIGAEATELIAELGFAITAVATFEEIEATFHAHPGSARQDGVAGSAKETADPSDLQRSAVDAVVGCLLSQR